VDFIFQKAFIPVVFVVIPVARGLAQMRKQSEKIKNKVAYTIHRFFAGNMPR
jgi:hypothetical protein